VGYFNEIILEFQVYWLYLFQSFFGGVNFSNWW